MLPTFSIRVDVPERVAIADTSFPVKVSAEYTFGAAVQGVAVVNFSRYDEHSRSKLTNLTCFMSFSDLYATL